MNEAAILAARRNLKELSKVGAGRRWWLVAGILRMYPPAAHPPTGTSCAIPPCSVPSPVSALLVLPCPPQDEISDALERIIAGPEKKNAVMSEKKRRLVAYHEAGHAVVSWVLPAAGCPASEPCWWAGGFGTRWPTTRPAARTLARCLATCKGHWRAVLQPEGGADGKHVCSRNASLRVHAHTHPATSPILTLIHDSPPLFS